MCSAAWGMLGKSWFHEIKKPFAYIVLQNSLQYYTSEPEFSIVKKFGKSEKDVGCTAVQIAILTERINSLRPHFDQHNLDHHSNRGLLKMIGKRRRLLKYFAETNDAGYQNLIKELGLRK